MKIWIERNIYIYITNTFYDNLVDSDESEIILMWKDFLFAFRIKPHE